MAHPNEDLLAAGYKGFASGDVDTLTKLWADDAVAHVLGGGRLGGDYNGRDAVFAFFLEVATLTDGTFSLEIHDLLANDVHGIALATTRAEREGRSFEGQDVHVFHITDGQITEAWFFDSDQAAAVAFFD
jgi:ketosteroid isomerase-like protein